RERAAREDAHGVLPFHQLDLVRGEEVAEVAQFGPARVHGDVTPPQQPLHTYRGEAALEHPAVHTAPGEIDVDVRRGTQRGQRVLPGPAPADVSEDEPDLGVAAREAAQLGAVGRLLSRPVA